MAAASPERASPGNLRGSFSHRYDPAGAWPDAVLATPDSAPAIDGIARSAHRRLSLGRPKLPVAGVAEARQDIAVLVEGLIHGR